MPEDVYILCDESTAQGEKYSNFYGGALVRASDLAHVEGVLRDSKRALNLCGEAKWNKISLRNQDKYVRLMDSFFRLISLNLIKIRIMFLDNRKRARHLTSRQRQDEYFILYYHFLKHAFGLSYHDEDEQLSVHLLLDQLPGNAVKCDRFKAFVARLNRQTTFTYAGVRFDEIDELVSHEYATSQCLDVVLGSMQFRLNKKHMVVPCGMRRRANRTRAKEHVYRHINSKIQEIYPNFNIGITTGHRNDNANRWRDPYRHWLFKSREAEVREIRAA